MNYCTPYRQQIFAKQPIQILYQQWLFYVFAFNLDHEKFNNLSVGKKLSIDEVKGFKNNEKAWI